MISHGGRGVSPSAVGVGVTRLGNGISGHLITAATLATAVAALDHGRSLNDRYRSFQRARATGRSLGPASSVRAVLERAAEPLARALGYHVEALAAARGCTVRLRSAAPGDAVPKDVPGDIPMLVVRWGERLDAHWRDAIAAARSQRTRWAWLMNGTHLRVLDAAATHTRRWLQVDLDAAADDSAIFAALWLATADARALDRLVIASDAFAVGVCRSLREGVLAASEQVLDAVSGSHRGSHGGSRRQRRAVPAEALEQALTVVYRILFLLFAESRGLVPMWHPLYRHSYSIDALRTVAERGRPEGLWDALRAMSRLASAGCRTGVLNVTAFNGRLFDARQVPLVDRRDLDDRAAQQAVLALTTRPAPHRGGRERIAYADLGVEQLGAVYEALLDYRPVVRDGRLRLAPGSGARKASGSFYTPQPIARYLVRQTLAPLVAGRSPEQILALRVLDPSMGSGAFLVAACGFLAESYEEALIATGACAAADIDDGLRARLRRTIAERCLFGVDVNPMAVQLGRLSLWLATLAGDRPLSFLDHHIRTGDSLVGTWLSLLREPPRPGRRRRHDDRPALFDVGAFATAARALLPARFALSGPSDTVDQVRGKEAALARLERTDSVLGRWKQVADLWCATWFADTPLPRAAYATLTDVLVHGRGSLPSHVAQPLLEQAATVARARHFFHWELEFPEVFFDTDGQRHAAAGFDAIIGNPPWDMVRGDGDQDGHGGSDEPDTVVSAKAEAARTTRFARESGAYEAPASGHVNRYQLFVERSVALLRSGGRLGLVLPGGLLSDHGSAPLRRLLFSRCAVDGVVTFDNRQAIFPIHRSVRFVVVTATHGSATTEFAARFGERDVAVLEQPDSGTPGWFPVRIGQSMLQRVSGDDLSVPDVPGPIDVALLDRTASLYPPLGSPHGWHAHFGRELNATDDRHLLHPASAAAVEAEAEVEVEADVEAEVDWPVIEGKLLHPFAVTADAATQVVRAHDARARLGARAGRRRLAYRDVASATNRQTLIAALLPSHSVSTHTVFCLKTPLPVAAQHFLCGLFNSWVLNYLVRQRVTTHVTTAIVERLPVPTADMAPGAFTAIAALARLLQKQSRRRGSARRDSNARDASDARPGKDEGGLAPLLALNAVVAELYQLNRAEYAHLLDTFPLVPAQTRMAALAAFDARA